jgi:outer membrane protein TolC
VASADAAAKAAEEDASRAERRRDAGVESEANVLALRVHLARMRERRVAAARDEALARAELNTLMGAPLEERRDLALEPIAPDPPVDLTALEDAALRMRPEVEQARLRRQAAEAGRAAARGAFLPQVVLQGVGDLTGADVGDRVSSWTVGAQVRWNLFAGFTDRARLAGASAAVDRSAAELERIERDVRLDVRAAAANLESAAAREAIGRAAVAQARESHRMTRDRYEAGLASAADLLRAAASQVEAEAAHTAAVADVYTSRAALKKAAG